MHACICGINYITAMKLYVSLCVYTYKEKEDTPTQIRVVKMPLFSVSPVMPRMAAARNRESPNAAHYLKPKSYKPLHPNP